MDPLVEALDQACLKAFGVLATWQPQAGGLPLTLNGIFENPAMAEDYIPGSTQGVNVVRFFVRFADLTPSPQKGDTAVINGINYDVFDVLVDREGGAVLKLRRNG